MSSAPTPAPANIDQTPPTATAPGALPVGAAMAGLDQLTLPECHAVIGSLAAQVNDLQALVALLQERLKLDSKNSSKPPSSDGPGRGNRAQRRASDRLRGAQKGHKGTSRAMLDETEVDQIIDCLPPYVFRGYLGSGATPRRRPHAVVEFARVG